MQRGLIKSNEAETRPTLWGTENNHTQVQTTASENHLRDKAHVPPAHEVVFLAGVSVPHGDVYKAASFIVQMEIELFSPLRIQRLVYCLRRAKKKTKKTTCEFCVRTACDFKRTEH